MYDVAAHRDYFGPSEQKLAIYHNHTILPPSRAQLIKLGVALVSATAVALVTMYPVLSQRRVWAELSANHGYPVIYGAYLAALLQIGSDMYAPLYTSVTNLLTLALLGTAAVDGYRYLQARGENPTPYYLHINPRVDDKFMVRDNMIVRNYIGRDGEIILDYKGRPLINVSIDEDGRLLYNRQRIVCEQQGVYHNLDDEQLYRSPRGSFWNSSGKWRNASPVS